MKKAAIILSALTLLSAAACSTAKTVPVNEEHSEELSVEISLPESSTASSDSAQSPESSLQERTKTESSKQESSKAEPSKQESLKTEPSNQESSKAEPSNQESSKTEPSNQESSKAEPSNQESSKTEPSNQESSMAEPSKQESSMAEPSKQESSMAEPSKQGNSKTEPSKQESSNTDNIDIDPDIPEITWSRSTIDRIDITWEPVRKADGYTVQYSTSESLEPATSGFADTNECKISIIGLEHNQKYYFRVCAYRSLNSGQKSYSDWGSSRFEALKTIQVVDGVTYVDGVLIVNKTYSLPDYYGDGLDSEAETAFYNMVQAAANDGIYLYNISGFRSYWTQSYTYNSFVYDRGVEQADRCSARPGHSEHQTGLAIDINTTSDYFDGTPEAIWIAENCVRFGFIIRYPKGKEDVTGYKYEPWHVRYLGTQKAKEIADSGLTLEEYYGLTSVYQ